MITLEIHNTHSKALIEDWDLRNELSDELSYMMEGAEFVTTTAYGWDGRVRLMAKSGNFPAGLTEVAYKFLRKKGYTVSIDDKRKRPKERYDFTLLPGLRPREYQIQMKELSPDA